MFDAISLFLLDEHQCPRVVTQQLCQALRDV